MLLFEKPLHSFWNKFDVILRITLALLGTAITLLGTTFAVRLGRPLHYFWNNLAPIIPAKGAKSEIQSSKNFKPQRTFPAAIWMNSVTLSHQASTKTEFYDMLAQLAIYCKQYQSNIECYTHK